MEKQCETCRKWKTGDCPRSKLCLRTKDRPHYEKAPPPPTLEEIEARRKNGRRGMQNLLMMQAAIRASMPNGELYSETYR